MNSSQQLTGLIMVLAGTALLYTFFTGSLPNILAVLKTNQVPVTPTSAQVSGLYGAQGNTATSGVVNSILNLYNSGTQISGVGNTLPQGAIA